jgi:hypothetical protein
MSTIATNTITNVAGNATGVGIAVSNASTYNSEGGAVTQNLVNSLVTTYCKWAATSTALKSFNIASITDSGLGDWTLNIANNYDSVNYIANVTANSSFQGTMVIGVPASFAAGSLQCYGVATSGSNKDVTMNVSLEGDLA